MDCFTEDGVDDFMFKTQFWHGSVKKQTKNASMFTPASRFLEQLRDKSAAFRNSLKRFRMIEKLIVRII